jgi:hypothetical protein
MRDYGLTTRIGIHPNRFTFLTERQSDMASKKPFVYIIESPKPEDLLDNRFEGRVLEEALGLAEIPYSYSLSISKEMFVRCMGPRLSNEILRLRSLPILHLSMHGDQNGIALTDGEHIEWSELAELIRPLVKILKGRLIISLSACYSAAGCRMAMTNSSDLPFGLLVGSLSQVAWADAAVAYVAFYHRLFKGASMYEAVEAMKSASGEFGFAVFDAPTVRESWSKWVSENTEACLQIVQDSLRDG